MTVVERHREDSRALYPDSVLYRSVEEMLQDPEIEVVVVNTPVQTHYQYAKEALLAGKHVLVEKPFTLTAEEAQASSYWQEKKANCWPSTKIGVMTVIIWRVKEVIESGVLGELKEVEIRFDRFRTEISSKAHKETAERGGGALYDLGAHLIDQALQLFGQPKAIYADKGYLRPHTQADDYFELLLFYDHQLRVRLKSTTYALERQWEYTLHGTRGSFLQQRFDGQEAALVAGAIPTATPWMPRIEQPNGILHTLESRTLTTAQHGNYWQFYEDFYQALIGKKENPVPAAQAIATMEIICR